MNTAVDGDFQREPHELTWREREVMIRDGHRRWRVAQRKTDSVIAHVSARRGAELDAIDDVLDDQPLPLVAADVDLIGSDE